MKEDMLQKALKEIEIRIKLKSEKYTWNNTFIFNQPLECGTYQLIISDVGFLYFKNELEHKFKKAIKYMEKNHGKYYFFTIYENEEGDKLILM